MVHSWVLGSDSSVGSMEQGQRLKKGISFRAGLLKSSGLKLTRSKTLRGARLLFFIAAFCVLFTGLSFMRSSAESPQSQSVVALNEKVVSVDSGDTLWAIAGEVKRDHMDIRDAVHRIMKRNGLTTSALQSGQKLIIPASVMD